MILPACKLLLQNGEIRIGFILSSYYSSMKKYEPKDSNNNNNNNLTDIKSEDTELIKNRIKTEGDIEKQSKKEIRKEPFKYYHDKEERDKSLIQSFEKFFDDYAPKKDKQTFLNAIDVFSQRSSAKSRYIDFIYAAMIKMDEYGANRDLNVYRRLLAVFPVVS
jgi:hypothetical protein